MYHPEPSEVEGRLARLIIKAMSLPENMGSPRKQFYFQLFHSATTVFCFMNSVIYWLITRPHDAAAAAVTVGSEVAANLVKATSGTPCSSTPFH